MRRQLLRSAPVWRALSISMLCLVSVLVAARVTLPFDRGLIQWAVGSDGSQVLGFLVTLSELGSTVTIGAVTLCALVLLVIAERGVEAMRVALIVGASAALTLVMKNGIGRARPDLIAAPAIEDGFSFPSGHASMSVAAYGAIALLAARSSLRPMVRIALVGGLITLIIAIGASRTYLGVHYPTDIVGGWLTGLAAILLADAAAPWVRSTVSRLRMIRIRDA